MIIYLTVDGFNFQLILFKLEQKKLKSFDEKSLYYSVVIIQLRQNVNFSPT